MNITIRNALETLHIRSWADSCCPESGRGKHAGTVVVFVDDWGAHSFLRRHFGCPVEMIRLRSALGGETMEVIRFTDDDVLRAAAQRLRSGAWKVCRHTAQGAQAASGPERASNGAALRAPAAPPAAPARAAVSPPAPAPAPSPLPVPEAAWPETTSQVMQAQTLVAAAKTGAPFCEICEQRKRVAAA